MSFILDALRKSEHERQRQTEPGIADIRAVTRGRTGFPVWALALGALLLLNVIVVAVVVFRSNSTPAAAPTAAEGPAATTTVAAAAPAVAPSAATPAPAPSSTQSPPPPAPVPQQQLPAAAPTQVPQAAPEAAPAEADPTLRPPPPAPVEELADESYENLPTLGDVQSHGATLPELHLDLHVYASRPADRFVFLNTRKYREGGKTPEGTTVERITPDGVVLNHHGVRFLLPRQ